jgi:uncharacterized protein DUF4333
MKGIRRFVIAMGGGTLALLAAGCTSAVRTVDLQDRIKSGFAAETGLPVVEINCPETRDRKKGAIFECTGKTKAGASFKLKVTQTDDRGTVSWALVETNGLLSMKKIEANVAASIKNQMQVEARLICGPPEDREAEPGKAFQCRATAPNGEGATVTITVIDMAGQVRWDLTPDAKPEANKPGTRKSQGGNQPSGATVSNVSKKS